MPKPPLNSSIPPSVILSDAPPTPSTQADGHRSGVGDEHRSAANAVTDFGTAGPVVAPVGGAVCAWYAAELRRTPPRGLDTEHVNEDTLRRDHTAQLPMLRDVTGRIFIGEELLARARNRDDPVVTVTTTRKVDHKQPHQMPDFLPDNYRDTRVLRAARTRRDQARRGSLGLRLPGRTPARQHAAAEAAQIDRGRSVGSHPAHSTTYGGRVSKVRRPASPATGS